MWLKLSVFSYIYSCKYLLKRSKVTALLKLELRFTIIAGTREWEKQLAADQIENKRLRRAVRQLIHYFLNALPTSPRLCPRKSPDKASRWRQIWAITTITKTGTWTQHAVILESSVESHYSYVFHGNVKARSVTTVRRRSYDFCLMAQWPKSCYWWREQS